MTPELERLRAQLRAYLDNPRCRMETLYEGHPSVLIREAAEQIDRLTEEGRRKDEAMRKAAVNAVWTADFPQSRWSCSDDEDGTKLTLDRQRKAIADHIRAALSPSPSLQEGESVSATREGGTEQ